MLGIKMSPTTETNLKSLLIMSLLLSFAGLIGSLVAGTSGLIVSLGFSAALPAVVFWFSREIAIWSMNAKEVKPGEITEGFDLNAIIENLRHEDAVNLTVMPKVCVMDTEAKNAFATGRSQGHAAIAITRGLLKEAKRYAKDDMEHAQRLIEAILLHELGHIVNGDIATKTVASVMTGSIRVLSESLYKQRVKQRDAKPNTNFPKGKQQDTTQNTKPSLFSRVGEYLLFNWIVPYSGKLLGLCLSRTREFAADDMAAKCGRAKDMAEAFELLRKPGEKGCHHHSTQMEAFAGMMCASLNPVADQQRAERLKSKNIGHFEALSLRISGLFSTHPPLDDRIKRMNAHAEHCKKEIAALNNKRMTYH